VVLNFRREMWMPNGGKQQRTGKKYEARALELAAKLFILMGWNGQSRHSNPTRLLVQLGYIPFYYSRSLVFC
jgi:hypothetical protein